MKLINVRLRNFRGYRNGEWIDIGSLTTFIGENDVGKSTLLEALDVFFNGRDADCPISPEDFSKGIEEDASVEIRCLFSLSSPSVKHSARVIRNEDMTPLLNEKGLIEIAKRYSRQEGKAISEVIVIRASRIQVPVGAHRKSLLCCSRDELRKAKVALKIRTSANRESSLRLAIYRRCLTLEQSDIPYEDLVVGKGGDVSVEAWNLIRLVLPVYNLFRADRENSDSESEVQDPLRQVVKTCLSTLRMRKRLDAIVASVRKKLNPVVAATVRFIQDLKPINLTSLSPQIPDIGVSRWADVFKGIFLSGDEGIPMNRRGSGIKRMVLVGFFRARAEAVDAKTDNVIYAIEEPETGQHFNHQRDLAESFVKLAKNPGVQVLLTTHSPVFVSRLSRDSVRRVFKDSCGVHAERILESVLPFPSMNEVNYIAFKECREAYLNELYGYVEGIPNGKTALRAGCPESQKMKWTRGDTPLGKDNPVNYSIAYYVRNWMHHPENPNNPRPTDDNWRDAIDYLRSLILSSTNPKEPTNE